MAISGSLSTSANWVGAMVISLGADYVRKLGQQDIRIYELTGRALANLTISGEVPLSPTIYNSHVEASRALGAPIAWNVPGPVPVTDTSTALALKAPHPHAAMLLIDFLMSKEGQAIYRDLGYVPSRNGMAPKDLPVLQKLYLTNRPNYVQEFEAVGRAGAGDHLQGRQGFAQLIAPRRRFGNHPRHSCSKTICPSTRSAASRRSRWWRTRPTNSIGWRRPA